MGTIEDKLINTLTTATEKFENDPKIKEFEKASLEFKNLVQAGIAKERGYNLLTVEDAHLSRAHFNTASGL
ncbi:hypothetical protein [Dawidia soli]|uniref:Uncharacterized protein n=1 Tax=Dawidia soli TaxID=2782352 RepID=A0AAP2GHH3_9BACT|nr:hypothetical protein [Dawidia soli]MBT1687216.1 hypothetical protein [Dawidia soli]